MTTRKDGRSRSEAPPTVLDFPGIAHALWFAVGQSSAPACCQLRMRRRLAALGGRKGSSRRRGRRGCGCLVRVGATATMPGIVELPTLEDLKVQEVRLVRRTGKRGMGLQLPGPGPSPASTQQTLGPGTPNPCTPTKTQVNPRKAPSSASESPHPSPQWF